MRDLQHSLCSSIAVDSRCLKILHESGLQPDCVQNDMRKMAAYLKLHCISCQYYLNPWSDKMSSPHFQTRDFIFASEARCTVKHRAARRTGGPQKGTMCSEKRAMHTEKGISCLKKSPMGLRLYQFLTEQNVHSTFSGKTVCTCRHSLLLRGVSGLQYPRSSPAAGDMRGGEEQLKAASFVNF